MANKLENQHPISEHLRELDKDVTSAEATIGEVREKVEKFNKEAFKSDLSKKTKESLKSLHATLEKYRIESVN